MSSGDPVSKSPVPMGVCKAFVRRAVSNKNRVAEAQPKSGELDPSGNFRPLTTHTYTSCSDIYDIYAASKRARKAYGQGRTWSDEQFRNTIVDCFIRTIDRHHKWRFWRWGIYMAKGHCTQNLVQSDGLRTRTTLNQQDSDTNSVSAGRVDVIG